jgi:L-serine dehydratase
MEKFVELAKQRKYQIGKLTIGECIELAAGLKWSLGEVVIAEAMVANQKTKKEVETAVMETFKHNLRALEIGLTADGTSFLMGKVGSELADRSVILNNDVFIDKALRYTLAAQVGNHSVGLQPCAGTGDACTLTGLARAIMETVEDDRTKARLVALMLKIATIFRAGKTTTGCNMEGFGAGAAVTAAVIVEMMGGGPEQIGKAMVLALSPTIGVPCTPRVMVPGLCATHIGGGVLIGSLSASLVTKTSIPVTVPIDVMIALAAAVHPESAKHIVPTVIHYMEPFFKTYDPVEEYIAPEIIKEKAVRVEETVAQAREEARKLAGEANPIIKALGNDAVVGGSSQAVGSPTNAARIAHALAKGKITGVKIELYPELFARRGINVPGILMAAVYGSNTDDAKMYREIMDSVRQAKINIEINEVDVPQLQRVTIYATEQNAMVDALNRGGARLALRMAEPSLEEARIAAKKLNINVVD